MLKLEIVRMVFILQNKVALVTGGASGIGLEIVKELLRKGAKGITIADINLDTGEKAIKALNKEFGFNKVIFALTDVSNFVSFENAFKVTIDNFKNVDILINNAGIWNDANWEREIDVNLKGVINGLILGLEKYIKTYKQGEEGVIVNTSSVANLINCSFAPIYTATKGGVLAVTRCWGQDFHYKLTKVRVLAICPGLTDTPILQYSSKHLLKSHYTKSYEECLDQLKPTQQSPAFLSKETAKLLEKAPNGSTWVIEESKPAYEFIFPEKNNFEKNILK